MTETEKNTEWPILTFPEDEAALVHSLYAKANVILEYGSGGSTVLAAKMPGKKIFSVESDKSWAASLQNKFDQNDLPSHPILYHVDIGETGSWGRPFNDHNWNRFYRYPLSIWAEPFFCHPDVILIDGRMRPACFVATCLNIRKPVTILFDDYKKRPRYHVVEKLIKPEAMVGRMAKFVVEPQKWPLWALTFLAELCTEISYCVPDDIATERYQIVENDTLRLAGLL